MGCLQVYNAGTDILEGDPLGSLRVSATGIQQRDEMVWQFAADQGVPIVMLLSGGYARNSAAVISSSLLHLFDKFQLASTVTQ
jgi:histone deacetylase 11